MNITLGSLSAKDLHSLEDLDLLPDDVDLSEVVDKGTTDVETEDKEVARSPRVSKQSRTGKTNGFKWFEDMIEGSQLGYHSTRRKGHGQTADGATVTWEISEVIEEDTPSSSKKRKVEIEDEQMND